MVRDPATGDLYVGDRFGIHQVTPAGAVLPLLAADAPEHHPAGAADGPIPPLTPCHLALHGRVLLIGDPYRGERFALHLDSRKLGAIRSAAGPLGVAPDGLCFLAGPQGLWILSLAALAAKAPGRAVPPERPSVVEPAPVSPWSREIPPPARCGTPGPDGRSARQLNLEHPGREPPALPARRMAMGPARFCGEGRGVGISRRQAGPPAGAGAPPRRPGPWPG
jgi:hypothetical protein